MLYVLKNKKSLEYLASFKLTKRRGLLASWCKKQIKACKINNRDVLKRIARFWGPSWRERLVILKLKPRGFTLVELMVVIALVGILAALAQAGFVKYLHYSYTTEVSVMLKGIKMSEEVHREEHEVYLDCSSSITNYYPRVTPDDRKAAWINPSHSDYGCWKQLSIDANTAVRYVYSVVAGGPDESPPAIPGFSATLPAQTTPWFIITASGDVDGDGNASHFFNLYNDGTIRSVNDLE